MTITGRQLKYDWGDGEQPVFLHLRPPRGLGECLFVAAVLGRLVGSNTNNHLTTASDCRNRKYSVYV